MSDRDDPTYLPLSEWRSPDDARRAELDLALYGNAFLRRGADGKIERVDPSTIEVCELPEVQR